MENKKPKYLRIAEERFAKKNEKHTLVFESDEFKQYLENRKKTNKPDLPNEELYKKFLRTQKNKRYYTKKFYGEEYSPSLINLKSPH
jgi:hypothetical protein